MKQFTQEQIQAIHEPTSLCVIASAGTGKTTVLTERFVYAYEERHIPLQNLLAFTFTEKAAREMKERVLQHPSLSLFDLPFLQIGTIHSFCASILRKYGSHIGLAHDFCLLNAHASTLLQKRAIRLHLEKQIANQDPVLVKAYELYGFKTLSKMFLQLDNFNLLSVDSKARKASSRHTTLPILDELLLAIAEWQDKELSQRVENKNLRFDDLDILTLKLFAHSPATLHHLQKQYQQILVDEFQDVSLTQYTLIRQLFHPNLNQLFIVGDPKQSIYGFRKANTELFYRMQNEILNNQGQSITLHHTFRTPKSQQENFNILFTELLCQQNPQAFESGIAHHELPHANLYGIADADEPDLVLLEILQKLRQQGTQWSQIVLLCCARTDFKRIAELLSTHAIPTQIDGKKDILQSPLVNLLVMLCLHLQDPQNSFYLTGVLRNQHFELTEEQIQFVLQQQSAKTDCDLLAVPQFKAGNGRLQTLWRNRNKWQEDKQTFTSKALCEMILSQLKIAPHDEADVHLQMFFAMLQSWQTLNLKTLPEVAELLQTILQEGVLVDDRQPNSNGVQLMTIHGSKGLEFEHVILWPGKQQNHEKEIFLFSQNDGFLFKTPANPLQLSLNEDLENYSAFTELKDEEKALDLEELYRLIYVALTRTKKNLYVFAKSPSLESLKKIQKGTPQLTVLKSYNDILYWITQHQQTKDILTFFELHEPNKNTLSPATQITQATAPTHFQPTRTGIKPMWTVTELKALAECPRFYQYRYQKGWVFQSPQKAQIQYTKTSTADWLGVEKGNFFHEVLQFYKPERNNLEEVVQQTLYNQHLKISFQQAVQETQVMLQGFAKHQTIWSLLFAAEETKAEMEFTIALQNCILTGQIDKLVKHDGDWMVLDYKTHSLKNETIEVVSQKFEFQLKCYALAVQKIFGQENIKAALIFTHAQDMRIFEFHSAELHRFEASLETSISEFQNHSSQDLRHTNDKSLCNDCLYHHIQLCDNSKPLQMAVKTLRDS